MVFVSWWVFSNVWIFVSRASTLACLAHLRDVTLEINRPLITHLCASQCVKGVVSGVFLSVKNSETFFLLEDKLFGSMSNVELSLHVLVK